MRIIEPKYKLGEKVGVVDLDLPARILPGWVIGTNLVKDHRGYWRCEYEIADRYNETHDEFSWVCDGVKEEDLRDESAINSE